MRQNEEVKRRFGDSFIPYGRDHGGHREGRRNFIEHTEYTNPDDGSQRTRVRFTLRERMDRHSSLRKYPRIFPASGEFVYILVQDKRNGDKRSAQLAKRYAGGKSGRAGS